jgi:hypothetical protein
MRFIVSVVAIAAAIAVFVAVVGTPALWMGGALVALLVLGCTIPSSFRDNLRLGLGIRIGESVKLLATDAERAEARVNKLADEIAENKRKVSDMRGTLNHEKNNVLVQLNRDLAAAIADYDMVNDELTRNPNDQTLAQTVAGQLDKVELARQAVETQEGVVATHQGTVDSAREAIEQARREITQLQGKVRNAKAKEKATTTLKTAASVLEASRDIANRSSGLGKDLNAVDEKHEQAKARFEDAQGSSSDRKVAELRAQRERKSTADWLANRRGGNTAGDTSTTGGANTSK